MIVAVKIKDWGWINCSDSNIRWTFDGNHLHIKTNAIDLIIPKEDAKVKKL